MPIARLPAQSFLSADWQAILHCLAGGSNLDNRLGAHLRLFAPSFGSLQ